MILLHSNVQRSIPCVRSANFVIDASLDPPTSTSTSILAHPHLPSLSLLQHSIAMAGGLDGAQKIIKQLRDEGRESEFGECFSVWELV